MSSTTTALRGMDVERLVLVPILSMLLFLNVLAFVVAARDLGGISTLEVLELLYRLLIIAFYVLLIVLLFIRTSAKDAGRDWVGIVLAYLGSFAPLVLLGLGASGDAGAARLLVSIVVMITGMAFAIYSLWHLGRSFGMIPRARELVTRGPYSWVRHPLYVGELVALLGVVIGSFSTYKAVVLVLAVALQVARATREERVLTATFPEYAGYRQRTPGFVPGVV
jgi:protein-S-isoprenylcysteine O-methyltransferase Ste14